MADRIAVMRDGVVEQTGEPLELYDRPANLFVATFIGSPAMNLLTGRLDGAAFVADNGTTLPLPSALPSANGAPVVYGIRPEHFRVGDRGVAVQVRVVEPTGAQTQVAVNAGGQELICIFHQRIEARPGDTIRIEPDPGHIFLFDQGTGARIPLTH